MGVEGEYYEGPCKLLELPHYVLSTLFSYVDATSLYHLSQTCNYLKEFIDDPLFWRYIDGRDDPNTCKKLHYCTNRVHERTTHLLLRGNLNLFDLPLNFFEKIKPFQNIRVLALENLKLQGSKVALKDFPLNLEELSLRRTYVKNSTYFFQHSVRNLSKLKVLILDECCWVTCSFLLSVSKYEHLEIISIVKCLRVHLNMIPYLNVAKFGCKKLKVFDCRFTGIGGELLRTFYSKESLQRLYFQSFKSAEVDYNEKIIDDSGIESKKNPPPDPNTAISIADIHLCEYVSTSSKAADEVEKVFDSLLYQDPYPHCTCSSMKSNKDQLFQENLKPENFMLVYNEIDPKSSVFTSLWRFAKHIFIRVRCFIEQHSFGTQYIDQDMEFLDDDMVHIPCGRGEPKFLCNKHMKDIVNLPSSFKDFFLSQQRQFNPASEAHFDTDSNSDDEEDGSCCYFGMGSSMILPSTHDRTPSRREEMTLPREGARNQASPGVFVLNPLRGEGALGSRNSNRINNFNNSFQYSSPPSSRNPKQSLNNSTKRRHLHSDSDTDSDSGLSKKPKRNESSDLDGLSSEAQAKLVNQLVESADDVSNRIERIMGENGMAPPIYRRISSESDENELADENLDISQRDRNSSVPIADSSRTPHNKLRRKTISTNDNESNCSVPADIHSKKFSSSSKNSTTRTESPINTDSSPSCSRMKTNTTQISRTERKSIQTSTSLSSSGLPCSIITIPNSGASTSESRTSSTQTRTEFSNVLENIDGPSCSRENICCSENDESSHLSDNDQEDSSSDSDSSSVNGYLSKRRKISDSANLTGTTQPNQKQIIQRNEHREPSHRLDPPRRNYLIIENQDRVRQKRKIPLRRLSLRGYRRVTDLTLNYIANLEIELIDLTCTSVTKQGIENFLVHNPNCRVIHPLYCTCKPKNPLL